MPIYLVFAVSFINGTAVQAIRVVLPLYALHLGASPLTVGILGASFAVLPLLLSVPAGKAADRFGSRWLLILAALGGSLVMLVPYFEPGLPAIFIAAAIVGLAFGIYSVSLQNLVGLLSSRDARAQNFSNYSLTNSVANFMGPLIGGLSIEHSGYDYACLYLAVLTLLPIALLVIWSGALPGGVRQVRQTSTGIRSLLAEPGVKKTLAASSLLLTGQDLYRIYMPVYGHAIGLSPSIIGIVLAAFSAAAFVVRLIMERLIARFKVERLLATSFYVAAVCLILMPLFKDAMMLALISFTFGLGMGCSQPIITMLMFSNSPEGRSGEALGLRMTVVHFTRLVGPVIFGAIGSALGLFPMFLVNALMMGAGGFMSQPGTKDRERDR